MPAEGLEPTLPLEGKRILNPSPSDLALSQPPSMAELTTSDPTDAQRLSALLSTDPRLSAIVTAWHDLPEPIRAGITAMVKASGAS